jgi:pimeloyl-ACP methyl ester carboxylesterase
LEAAFNAKLAGFSRLILFDRRGTGASERAGRADIPEWERWGEDLLAVLDVVGSQNASIFAEAEAGATAVLFAAAHPQRVDALVLGNTQARIAWADDYPMGMGTSEIEAILQLFASGWGDPRTLPVVFPSLAGDEPVLRSLARLCRAAASPRHATALYRYILTELDVRNVLPLVQAPTLVLHNSSVDTARARYLADHIAGTRLVAVPGSDALFFGGDHDPVISEVAQFLTGERLPVEVDRVLTTVLFTDIVGSTERAASIGDHRWRSLLDAQDRSVREQLRRFRGKRSRPPVTGSWPRSTGPPEPFVALRRPRQPRAP